LTDVVPEAFAALSQSDGELVALLAYGALTLEGWIPWSSNHTLLARVRGDGAEALVVYKPRRGERPLWDFDAGTLCQREVAAYLLSRALGWPRIPLVGLREGPLGSGSVQLFMAADFAQHYFTLRDRPEHAEAFRRLALFDYLTNNADRKGGHLLLGQDGRVWAIDHGLTFHTDYHLRTVIWEWAGQEVPAAWLGELAALHASLADAEHWLRRALRCLISPREVAALRGRVAVLLRGAVFPLPHRGWRNTPYPLL
jgi:uncharacterized repeat protein (TIGR03843 family)